MGDELAHNLYLNKDKLQLKSVPKSLAKLFRPQPLRHYVIAVKHQPDTLYKILFQPATLIVYASFPITSTRHDPARIENINRFRSTIANKFAVLDPVTIDELRLRQGDRKTVALSQRWPIGWPNAVTNVPDSLKISELNECKYVIAAQIEERDYRLVDSCDCVAAYRPFYGGRLTPAHGVEAEISRALSRGREKAIFHPPEDGSRKDLERSLGVLDVIPKVPIFDDFKKFVKHLEEIQRQAADVGGPR